ISSTRRPVPSATDKVLLEARAISTRKLHDISFTVREGEIIGVAGLVGSGRSELGRMLFGTSPLTSGSLMLNGSDFRPCGPHDAVKRGVALVPEDRQRGGLVPRMGIRGK